MPPDRTRKKRKKKDSSLRMRRKKTCYCCENQVLLIDYKDEKLLGRFVTDRGKIVPRRISGACARHQRGIATAVKRSRALAILPYVSEQVQ
ncbi:MAG: 30S ribosomal protein S18 [Gemmatimonadota bacterium]